MITQSIQARLYQGFNLFQNQPQQGLPQLAYLDLPLELNYGTKLADHKLSFTKAGIKYIYSLKSVLIDAELQELVIRFRLTTTTADGELIHMDFSKTLRELEHDGFAYYDPTRSGLNSFQEFENRKAAVGADGVAVLTDGEFIGRRALNGIIHATGFWLQFPFDAATGDFQQPLVVGAPVVALPTALGNDGTITIPVAAGTGVVFSMNPADPLSWQASNQFTGLAGGDYTVYAMQQTRPKVILTVHATVPA